MLAGARVVPIISFDLKARGAFDVAHSEMGNKKKLSHETGFVPAIFFFQA